MDIDVEHEELSSEQIEQLLSLVARLRHERNTFRSENEVLHRDFDFLRAESKFTIDSLRKQLSTTQPLPLDSSAHTSTPHITHLERAALVSAIVAQHADAERAVYASRLEAMSVSIEQANTQTQAAKKLAAEREVVISKIRSEDMEMRDNLASTEYRLANLESRNIDLTALVTRYQEELEQGGQHRAEISGALARSEAQLADAVKQLEDVESQRSSLALQITHLEQDLHAAKGEVAEAESRYSVLQSQQLAAMSSTEQLRTLRKQIEDQEQRVLRRNEQIGIHQHDIRRLETNLKLQEERVMEMTGELETAEAEKLAMIEDCRTTREERDEALKRCERLEESAEVLEETVASMGRQRDVELTSMVGVVVTSSAKRRQISVSYSETLLRYRTKIAQLSAEAQEARQSAAAALSAAEHQTTLYQATLAQLDSVQEQLRLSEMERLDVERHNTQATVALVTVLRDLRQSASASESFRGQALSLQEELAEVKKQFEANLNEFAVLKTRHSALLDTQNEQSSNVSAWESRYGVLDQTLRDLQSKHDQALEDLSRAQEELRTHLSDSTHRLQEENILREELDAAQRKFDLETASLRTQLSETKEELENAKLQRSSSESAHRQTLDDLSAAKDGLHQSLAAALEKIARWENVEDELKLTEERHSGELEQLRETLDTVNRTLEDTTKAHDDLISEHASVAAELEQRKEEISGMSTSKENLEQELEALRLQYDADKKALQQRVDDATSQKAADEQALVELQARYDEALRTQEELTDSLTEANTALEGLKLDLRAEIDRHRLDTGEHAAQLEESREKQREAVASQSQMEAETATLRQHLLETKEALANLQHEKEEVQVEITTLQANIQRSLSLQRSQEVKVQEREREISDLQHKLEAARTDYGRSEQAAKATEMELTLQTIKHKEVVDTLRAQLANLQPNSELQETILELQEKIEDLEKLLQEKNAEIEENDDRFIQNTKEKKELNSKVDALSRKVKALEDKLQASSSSQQSTPRAAPIGPPLLTPAEPTQPRAVANAVPSSSRSRSVTVSIPRPKTPEAIKSIFRVRTPEPKHLPPPPPPPVPPVPQLSMVDVEHDPLHDFPPAFSSSSIGKKRRAPDDFDDHESVPVQYFSVESAPVGGAGGSRTPRGKQRVGFTPVRGGSARSAPTQGGSPRRATTGVTMGPAIIADVTNSPRSKSNVLKRGWAKMKPGSAQGPTRTSSSRPPPSDRVQNLLGS